MTDVAGMGGRKSEGEGEGGRGQIGNRIGAKLERVPTQIIKTPPTAR